MQQGGARQSLLESLHSWLATAWYLSLLLCVQAGDGKREAGCMQHEPPPRHAAVSRCGIRRASTTTAAVAG